MTALPRWSAQRCAKKRETFLTPVFATRVDALGLSLRRRGSRILQLRTSTQGSSVLGSPARLSLRSGDVTACPRGPHQPGRLAVTRRSRRRLPVANAHVLGERCGGRKRPALATMLAGSSTSKPVRSGCRRTRGHS